MGGMDWIGLAQDRCQFMVVANTVLNLVFDKVLGNY
jgi:hypothetical protein